MPELPDVQYFKQYLDSTALHQKVGRLKVHGTGVLEKISARKLRAELENHSFESTCRHGKYLFIHMDSPAVLVLHFGMTGYLDYARNDRKVPDHTRVVFHFVNEYRLAYVCQRKLGRITLTNDIQEFIEAINLGPDALDKDLSAEVFCDRMSDRRATVKSTLMNQSILAGIGNIYADEILFQTGIAPNRGMDELHKPALRKIYRTMRRVLATAIRNNADISRLPRTYLLRHRGKDGRCPRCHRKLNKVKVSGRGTWFCPHCQRA